MTVAWTSSGFRLLRSRLQLLLIEKRHQSNAFIYRLILKLLYTTVNFDKILDKLAFNDCRSKVKVTVAISEKDCQRSSIFTYWHILI